MCHLSDEAFNPGTWDFVKATAFSAGKQIFASEDWQKAQKGTKTSFYEQTSD